MFDQIEFLTPARIGELWQGVKTLLTFASPSVMIAAAISGAGMLLIIVVSSFKKAEKNKPEDDDDYYEVRRY